MSAPAPEGDVHEHPMLDLRGYLMRTFLVACACAALAEAAVFQVLDRLVAPAVAQLVGSLLEGIGAQATTTQLLAALPRLLMSFGLSFLSPAERPAPATSGILLLLLFMLALVIAPVAIAAFAYALLVDRKIKAVQATYDEERRQQERSRNLIIADLAHDLRTPITSIAGLSQALADGMVKEDEKRHEYLETIAQRAYGVSDMVTLLLEYTQLDSEGFRLNRARVDLAELLLEVAAQAYPDAEREGILVVADIPERPCPIYADDAQLRRVFSNLVTNAIRHNPRGTTIAVGLEVRSDLALASVADTGEPISESMAELLRPFSRGDASRSTQGFGLGLSVAKRISDMHGFGFALRQPAGAYTKSFVVSCPILADVEQPYRNQPQAE